MILNISDRGFRTDNTTGYNQEQLDAFNHELEERLQVAGVATGDPEYYDIIHAFEDEVARR